MNDLTNANVGGLDLFFGGSNPGLTGFEDIDQSDLAIGKYKLLQPLSEEVVNRDIDASSGQFYNAQTGVAVDEINCYLLSVSKSRAGFEYPFKKGSTAICSSIDCVTGRTRDSVNKSCQGCPHADWNKAKADGKEKPDCTQSYVWLGADLENDVPFRMTVGGAAFKSCRQFISQQAMKGAALFTYDIKISSKQVNSPKGSYYEPVFTIVNEYTANDLKSLSPEKQAELIQVFTARQELLKSLKDIFENARRHDAIHGDIVEAEATEVVEDAGETGTMF